MRSPDDYASDYFRECDVSGMQLARAKTLTGIIRAAQADALEQAAKVVENLELNRNRSDINKRRAADAIRAMIPKDPTP